MSTYIRKRVKVCDLGRRVMALRAGQDIWQDVTTGGVRLLLWRPRIGKRNVTTRKMGRCHYCYRGQYMDGVGAESW